MSNSVAAAICCCYLFEQLPKPRKQMTFEMEGTLVGTWRLDTVTSIPQVAPLWKSSKLQQAFKCQTPQSEKLGYLGNRGCLAGMGEMSIALIRSSSCLLRAAAKGKGGQWVVEFVRRELGE